jgi:hypothetical protein
MKQRIFSHFQDNLIQYISHQYQNLLYCNSSQYILSKYNSQHNNNNNVTPGVYDTQGSRFMGLCISAISLVERNINELESSP